MMAAETDYPRDFLGYGANPPDPKWPNGAKLALSFVLNYEEGGENTVLNGDAGSELYLHEVPGGSPIIGERNRTVESQFDYGARAGVWRNAADQHRQDPEVRSAQAGRLGQCHRGLIFSIDSC
jgi:hypothetical protein